MMLFIGVVVFFVFGCVIVVALFRFFEEDKRTWSRKSKCFKSLSCVGCCC